MKYATGHPRFGRWTTIAVTCAAIVTGAGTLARRWSSGPAIRFTSRQAVAAAALSTDPRAISFHHDIAPILRAHCAACHRPGDVGPFPLLTYPDAAKHGRLIARVTGERLMPPWKPEAGFGRFEGERRLTDGQIATLARWVEAGLPEGPKDEADDEADDGADARTADRADGGTGPVAESAGGWQLGRPDLILTMPEPFEVPAEGPDVYACFLLTTNVPRDRHVRAVEFRPGDRRVAHHAGLFYDTAGKARALATAKPGAGFAGNLFGPGFRPFGSLGGWAPGPAPLPLPAGTSRRLPRGCDLVLQVHYHPCGTVARDRTSVGLYFTGDPPTRALANVALGSARLLIPPGARDYAVTDEVTMPGDVQLVGLLPHAHAVCREMKAAATLPDGKVEPLLWIRDWDLNWQEEYRYREPVRLPKGTRVAMEFVYDNSSENIRNPFSPPRWIRFGEGTTDEMATLLLRVIPERNEDAGELKKLWDARFVRDLSGEFEAPGGG